MRKSRLNLTRCRGLKLVCTVLVYCLLVPGPLAVLGQTAASSAPAIITLHDAIDRARTNDPAFAASVADRGSAALDRSISRSMLLPQASFHTQYLYTQPNGLQNQAGQGAASQPAPRFIANNAIREYASQVLATETLSATNVVDYKRAGAAASKANADLEIARRDLTVRVVSAYFAVLAGEEKLTVAQQAADEANAFVDLTRKLEAGREVAHADVVKADLGAQQRQRELMDAQLAAERARLELGILLFPDPQTPYRTADEDAAPPPLPGRDDAQAAAARGNPDLKSAIEALRIAHDEVIAARTSYLPTFSLNTTYGIDAPQFAVNGPRGVKNLGYSAFAALDLPVWDWLATHDRVRQSELRQQAAQTTLTYTQRQLVAQFDEFYSEAKVANDQLASLDMSESTARESLRLTKLRYTAGEATALEVVDAENALSLASTARAEGQVRYRVALANLQTVTGIL